MNLQPAADRSLQSDLFSPCVLREDGDQQDGESNFYRYRHVQRISFCLRNKQRADERHMTREERAPEHGESELVDCMNCLVSSVPQSLEIETGPSSDQTVHIRGITHAVERRGGHRPKFWAGWTLCGMEFIRHEGEGENGGVEYMGRWAIPVGRAPGARGPLGSSDP